MEAISVDRQDQQPLDHFAVSLQHEGWTRQQLEEYQARALRACREYAYAHSPFYQRFHQGLMDRPLQDLPVLTRHMVMEHFDDLVTDRAIHLHDVQQHLRHADFSKLYLDRYRVLVTSGSSGQPGVFLYNRTEGAIVGNSYARCSLWGGITPTSRVAVVASTAPAHMSAQAPIIINGQRVARLQLSALEPLETLVQQLNEWQPDVLIWYSSIASLLENEQRQGRLHISPRSIFCGSETLPHETRKRIEATWQTKLFDVYGMTESGVLASECSSHQGMHLFEDYSIVEVVDQNNRPVPPGEQGSKVLLTVLFRRTQPLIRYEVTDLVCPSTIERCACGLPFALIEAIGGRTPEVLYFPSSTGNEEGFYPYFFDTIFDRLPISGWQVVQEHDRLYVFLTGASEELHNDYVLEELRKALSKRKVIVPLIQIQRVSALTRNASGKTPMLISHVPRLTS